MSRVNAFLEIGRENMYNLDSNRNYWKGSEAGNRRTMYKAAGFGDYDIKEKPHIGVANTF